MSIDQIEKQENEGRKKAFRIVAPLYRRLTFVSLVSYGFIITFAHIGNTFDYVRALAMVTGVLNIVIVVAVIYAYNVTRNTKFSKLLPRHIMYIGVGYVLYVLASLSIMIEHWGRPVSFIGTPIAMAASLFGIYGLGLMMSMQYVKELRARAAQEK